jgi:hypothetical protein
MYLLLLVECIGAGCRCLDGNECVVVEVFITGVLLV